MSSPDILFKGIPRSPTRGYTADIIRNTKPSLVVIPCTGSFALAWVAREAGITSDKIFCGDISLYSTAIGKAIMREDWRLEIKSERGEIVSDQLTDPLSKAAAVLFMARVLQYDRKNQNAYLRDIQKELIHNRAAYLLQLKEQLAEMGEALKGITYRAQDMWLTLEQFKDDPKTILLTNPPRYNGGYTRMFAGLDGIFSWDEPEATQFGEKDYARLMEMLGKSEAHTLMYYATQGEDPSPLWGEPWRAVFADRPGSKTVAAINWIIANKETDRVASRAKLEQGKPKFPLFNGEVTQARNLVPLAVDKATGDYYRDLFIHKLAGSVTEKYVALLMDGYLMSIVGLHLSDYRRGRKFNRGGEQIKDCAFVTFAFTVTHDRYPRLHKLTLMSLVSSWFWDDVLESDATFKVSGRPKYIATTMLTRHPENKTARGILTMDFREKLTEGGYRLGYSSLVIARSRLGTLKEWLNKYATLTK